MDLSMATELKVVNSLSLMITFSHKPSFIGNPLPSMFIFFLKIHLHPVSFIPSGGSTKVYTWFVYMESISDFMAISHLSNSELFRNSL